MRIDFTWPDHLIPMVSEVSRDQCMVDLFINSILLENDENTPRRLTRMVLDLMNEDQPLWRLEVPLPALMSHLAVDAELIKLSDDKQKNLVGEHLSRRIQNVKSDVTFQPGAQGLMRRFPVRFLASSAPDTLIARAFSGSHLIGRESISIKPFSNRIAFSFPVDGVWQTINNFDYTLGHRAYAGQEFAIDFVQVGPNGLTRKHETDSADDYYCFGTDIEAIADGVVHQMEDRMDDNPADCQQDESALEKRSERYGYLAGRSGNFVIIKHDDDRYSFYAHLMKKSIPLKVGDKVSKGQKIARVGNSGACSKAHLHMQLNDGPNPLGNRGLPMSFENLKDSSDNSLPMITQNNLVVHRG